MSSASHIATLKSFLEHHKDHLLDANKRKHLAEIDVKRLEEEIALAEEKIKKMEAEAGN